MPRDAGGNFHVGGLRPLGKEGKLPMGKPKEKAAVAGPPDHVNGNGTSSEKVTTVHEHGDGTFHTDPDGKQHANIGELHAHLSSVHGEPGAKHFHAHTDGMSAHSHSVESGGESDNRDHDPDNLEALKSHMNEFLDEEGNEPKESGGEAGETDSHEGLMGFQG
jgi:hypothetical protein